MRSASVALDGRAVLHGIDLEIERGLTVIRGPNGAGKTTLLRALAGSLPLASGERDVRGELLVLGHRPQLLRGLSARENLAFFARFRGADTQRVDLALAAWGVLPPHVPVERLSAGQRRRAALARLDVEPWDIALLDEPFAELDDEASRALAERILTLAFAERTIVVATHAHGELDTGRTVRLENGRVA